MVSVSVPAVGYFVDRLAGEAVDINVLVPASAGHSTYSPRPQQMVALGRSVCYLALGGLDFELTWKDRMTNAAPQMAWLDMSRGVRLIEGHCCHADEVEHVGHHHEATDPHYWLSPKQARIMAQNVARALQGIVPADSLSIDSALVSLQLDIAAFDRRLDSIAQASPHKAFMIYHPALSYLSADYGLQQFSVEKDGNEPTPQGYAAEIEAARTAGVGVVFVQMGYDVQKARSAAEALGAEVVEFAPEGEDWIATMNTIINALD